MNKEELLDKIPVYEVFESKYLLGVFFILIIGLYLILVGFVFSKDQETGEKRGMKLFSIAVPTLLFALFLYYGTYEQKVSGWIAECNEFVKNAPQEKDQLMGCNPDDLKETRDEDSESDQEIQPDKYYREGDRDSQKRDMAILS